MFLLQLRTDPYQTKILRYFTRLELVKVSKAALCKARQKLDANLFHQLADHLATVFYRHFKPEKWKGFRVLAVDGSTARLSKDRKGLTVKEYGLQTCGNVLVRLSGLYDVLNKVFIDAAMDEYQVSEQEMAINHMGKVQKGDLVLFDRNYASRLFISLLLQNGIEFLFRMTDNWNIVKEFKKKKYNTQIVNIKLTKKEQKDYPGRPAEFKVRLVKRKLKTGETIVFATSLLDEKEYKNSAIFDLYWKRWQIEESYKFMKARLEVENWSGLLPECHRQDFGAALVLSNLTACLARAVKLPDKPKKTPKRKQKPKERTAVVNMRQVMEAGKELLLESCRKQIDKNLFDRYLRAIEDMYEWIDPGRENPRKTKVYREKFSSAYG